MIRFAFNLIVSSLLMIFPIQAHAQISIFGPYKDGAGRLYCAGLIKHQIDYGTGKRLYDFLHSKIDPNTCRKDIGGVNGHELLKVIEITESKGGDLLAAMTIISLLQDYQIAVETWDRGPKYEIYKCVSSCAIIFAGAPSRHYVVGINQGSVYPPVRSKFGLHKPEFVVPENTFKNTIDREKKYDKLKYALMELVGRVGVKPDFIVKTFEISNNEIFIPLYVDLLMWGVVTSNKPYDPLQAASPYYR